jgi:hypothetical protein
MDPIALMGSRMGYGVTPGKNIFFTGMAAAVKVIVGNNGPFIETSI